MLGDDVAPHDLELVIVLGGDGTILRAAELARGCDAPLLGVNLGHVGFLAESEREDLAETVAARARPRLRGRGAHDAHRCASRSTTRSSTRRWALNEATVEKASRERSLEVVIEVDGRPLSSFGCDGVVMSTPTGSTAYSFSAGGPVVWPSVDALLLVPLSAHALFARPLVVGPDSSLAVEVLDRTAGHAACSGATAAARSTCRAGARVVVRRSPMPVRLARLSPGPFTDRLVNKFALPVAGWRGPQRDSREDEAGRDRRDLHPRPRRHRRGAAAARARLHRAHRRDRRGQDDGRHGARRCCSGERADAGAIRSGAAQAVVEGRWEVADDGPVAERVRDAGGDLDPVRRRPGSELILARIGRRRGPQPRGRRRSRGARRRARRARRAARRRARAVRPDPAAVGDRAARGARPARRVPSSRRCSATTSEVVPRLADAAGRARRAHRRARSPRAREADELRAAIDEIEAARPAAAARTSSSPSAPSASTQPRRPAARRRRAPTRRSRPSSSDDRPDAVGARRGRRGARSSGSPTTTRRSAPIAEASTRRLVRSSPRSPAQLSSYLGGLDADGARELETRAGAPRGARPRSSASTADRSTT